MKTDTVSALACPACRGELRLLDPYAPVVRAGVMRCSGCWTEYSIVDGIPRFIQPEGLTGFNKRFAGMYNWFSWGYRAFSRMAFAYIGVAEEEGRRELTDRLEPCGGTVLEVSIGPGVNLPYLVHRPDVSGLFGLDISWGQLQQCRHYAASKSWDVELFLGNGERLPFKDGTFGGVFHVGGINFFNDKKAAIDEMIRVSRPGARILIADENERGARAYEKIIPGFRRSAGAKRAEIVPPLDLVPPSMLERRVFDAWKGWLYCIEFRKPRLEEVG